MGKLGWLLGVLLAGASQGCAGYGTVIHVSNHFTPDEEIAIQAAADAWEAATDGSVHFELAFGQRVGPADADKRVLVRASDEREAAAWANSVRGLWTLADPAVAATTTHRETPLTATQTIAVVPTRFQGPDAHLVATMQQVVAHELGHAIGLKHLDDPAAVMNLDSAGAVRLLAEHCLPEADYRQVRAVVGLGPNFRVCDR